MPKRIQRRRVKGWRMPPNTICVTRPGPLGNPFIVNQNARPGTRSGVCYINVPTVEDAIECFRLMVLGDPALLAKVTSELRGKDLACFCKLDQPCHADILLELASAAQRQE